MAWVGGGSQGTRRKEAAVDFSFIIKNSKFEF